MLLIMNSSTQTINSGEVRDDGYMPTLDGWRAIAIIVVLFAHGSDSIVDFLGLKIETHSIHQLGLFGVQIFFGLSGFLITSRLISDEARRGKISIRSFYIRRAFRILPASLVFLLTVGILAWVGVLPISLGRWLSTLLFAANYSTAEESWYLGHFWSLAVEEHFYFVWPLAFLLLANNRRRLFAAISIAFLVAVWRAADFKFRFTGTSMAVFWGRTDIQADCIAWGVIVALLHGTGGWQIQLHKILRQPIMPPILLAFLLGSLSIPNLDWKLSFFLLTVKAATIPMLILAVMVNKSGVSHLLLETTPFKLLGRLSYSIYLWQQLFLTWPSYISPSISTFQTFPINLIGVLVCASLSMVYVERPLIKLGHALAKKSNT